jgi:hypothetical protein
LHLYGFISVYNSDWFGLGLWCSMPLSTIFKLYRGGILIGRCNSICILLDVNFVICIIIVLLKRVDGHNYHLDVRQ